MEHLIIAFCTLVFIFSFWLVIKVETKVKGQKALSDWITDEDAKAFRSRRRRYVPEETSPEDAQ